MGKIVKFCNACEEGFAEKFGFCPNCGAQLTAFEMSPVVEAKEPQKIEEPVQTVSYFEPTPIKEFEPIPETKEFSSETETQEIAELAESNGNAETAETFEFDDEVFEEPVELKESVEEETLVPIVAFSENGNAASAEEEVYNATYQSAPTNFQTRQVVDDNFRVTIVEEKNVKQRNMLLLGTLMILSTLTVGGWLYSMFNKLLDVAAIDSPTLLAYVGEVEPVPVEEIEIKKDKDKGGGGGGGKDEETPASKGRSAAQVNDPLFAPSISYDKVTNPTLAIKAATKNKNERPEEDSPEPYGLENGGSILSDGSGTGNGQGNGRGRGQGNGDGDGLGNGRGSGRGNGDGDGEGNNKGGGGNDFDNAEVVKKPVGPTVGLKIISKPRPSYTDSARQQNIQGTVLLKVTFLANGSIGGVSAVKGLGGGLTEQAIAAAKRISFEPAKRGGQPYSVTKTIEYSFNIY